MIFKNSIKSILLLSLFFIYSCDSGGGADEEEPEFNKEGTEVTSNVTGVRLTKYGPEYQSMTNSPGIDFSLLQDSGTLAWLNVDSGIGNAKFAKLVGTFDYSFFQAEPTKDLNRGTDDAIWWDDSALYGGAVNGKNYCYVDTENDGTFETMLLLYLNVQDLESSYFIGKAVKTDGTDLSFSMAKQALDELN
ncbi:hypothetical protein [Roseivirga sp.]|uniref:hypothetical protein n=1 Tax=Roseivirga sp. TaxID=1964215 RepID=UPI002B26F56A|nr:hypothetical protein [Roseivirga sp.]